MSDDQPATKRSRTEDGEMDPAEKNAKIHELLAKIHDLESEVNFLRNVGETYYSSSDCIQSQFIHSKIPVNGLPAAFVKERIKQSHELDNRPRLNTSSYVNVVHEPEEADICLMGATVNLADGSVYPASVRMHDTVVNMIAKLWHCPRYLNDNDNEVDEESDLIEEENSTEAGYTTTGSIHIHTTEADHYNYSGAGTVGSTEACLLAGLALKFRWRKWHATKHRMTQEQVIGVVPNIIISSCYQAAWEKFFRYFDVVPRFVKPNLRENKMRIDAKEIEALCDDKTLAVVGILGNHYNGAYDPIWDINDVVEQVNKKNGYQIGIHVDAASGGFIAPFQENMPAFDFRLKNVMSMSASGHKFGESSCGTGWLVFRHRLNLAEHIAVSVTYLGGKSDSITLNFSRPATAVYNQLYKFLRLGIKGYRKKVANQMAVAKYLRDYLKSCKAGQFPRYEMLDAGDEHCLPVVAARINPDLKLGYNDIDLQHGLAEYHWYVSGYSLNFEDFSKGGQLQMLCTDTTPMDTMFRVVVKSNLTMYLAEDLVSKLGEVVPLLDKLKGEVRSLKRESHRKRRSSYVHVC